MLRERRGGDRRQILGIAQTQSFHIATGVGFNQLEQQQSFSYLDRISKKKVEEERHWAVLYSSNINLSLSLCGPSEKCTLPKQKMREDPQSG